MNFARLLLDGVQTEDVVRQAKMSVPSLQYMRVMISGYLRTEATSYWMVSAEGNERQLTKVNHDEESIISSINEMSLPVQIQDHGQWQETWDCCISFSVPSDSLAYAVTRSLTACYVQRKVAGRRLDLIPAAVVLITTMTDRTIPDAQSLFHLNNDILLHLSRFMTDKDLLSIMRTCHALFGVGLPTLLERPRYLKPKTLRSFHNFLQMTSPVSFMSLRTLDASHFAGKCLSRDETSMIIDILQRAVNLQKLCLDPDIFSRKAARDAVASLNFLRNLDIMGDYNTRIPGILSQLHAPLEDLSLFLDNNNLIPMLANFCQSLKRLSVSCASFSCVGSLVFPKATHLNIQSFDACAPALIAAFPNVQDLQFELEGMGEGDTPDESDDLVMARQQSIEFQRRQRWDSLVSVKTNLEGLYALALQCRVPSVTITEAIFAPEGLDVAWLKSSLEPLQPQNLKIRVYSNFARLPEALGAGMGKLKHLDIGIEFTEDSDFQGSLDALFCTIGSLPSVELVDIEFLCINPASDNETVEAMLTQLDMETLAHRTVESSSTVVGIMIGIGKVFASVERLAMAVVHSQRAYTEVETIDTMSNVAGIVSSSDVSLVTMSSSSDSTFIFL
ncbi:hypothetical protein NM688_g7108 [Phlebia brevispora]|uniref:Uncharacterized protein n=1 Tax=Phlebia brevispora TaxID=194682 RepID=A0ACC1S993_9APHY|nr:hypothetical protein NM688_g7108 [Phlebia brevispora]